MIKNQEILLFKRILFFSLLLFLFFLGNINVLAKENQTIKTNFDSFTFSNVGAKKTLKATTSSNLPVSFSSSVTSIATVDRNGIITAKKPGSATIYINQAGNNDYYSAKKAVTVVVPKIQSRNEALQPWFDAMVTQQKWSWNASYDWARPTIENSKRIGTCITMPSVSLQRIGLLKSGEYLTGSTNTGRGCDLINSSINKMKKHPGYFEWYTPNKVPKTLINQSALIPGDLVTLGGHTMVYMGLNKNGKPVWNTSGRTGGSSGNRTAIKKRVTYYENTSICFIVRIKTHNINTSVINGSITGTNTYISGSKVTVKYSPLSGYKLVSVNVDGKNVSISKYKTSYTFNKLNSNHKIFVVYSNGDSLTDSTSDDKFNRFVTNDVGSQTTNSSRSSSHDTETASTNTDDTETTSTNTEQTINENILHDIDPGTIIAFYTNGNYEKTAGYNNCDLIPYSIMKFLKNLFLIIQVFGILILVIISIIEFIKALTTTDGKDFKTAFKNTFKRIIIMVIILILPVIIIWILNIINANAYETDGNGNYVFGENGNPLCQGYSSSKNTSRSKTKNTTETNNSINNNVPLSTNIAEAKIVAAKGYYTTSLSSVVPNVTVKLTGRTLEKNVNYSMSCSNNIKPGTGTCVVTGKGKFKGSKKFTFKLVNMGDDVAKFACRVSYSRGKTYQNGKYPGTKAYLAAWKVAGSPNSHKHPGRTCGAAVSTIYRASGYDKTMATWSTGALKEYLPYSTKWTKIGVYKTGKSAKANKLQPGDVLVRKGHIWMYVGSSIPKEIYKKEIKGKGKAGGDTGSPQGVWMSAHLNYNGQTAAAGIGPASWSLANNSYGHTIYIYRCTKPDNAKYRHGLAAS